MSGDVGQTTALGEEAEVDMSVDSGYTGSRDTVGGSQISDVRSQSGDSTATMVGLDEQTPIISTHFQAATPDHQHQNYLPKEAADPTVRTEQWVEDTFEVFVKNLDGKSHTIAVEKYEQVASFRQKVCDKLGMPGDQQRLTSQEGKTLQDGHSLCDYNIKKHSTVYCQGRLRGGHVEL